VYTAPNGDTEESSESYSADGKILRRTYSETKGKLPVYRSDEKYDDDGELTEDEISEGQVGVGSTTTRSKYDHGNRKSTTTIKYDAATKTITESTEEYGYDNDGRLRRITVRDKNGNVTKVITIDFHLDGTWVMVTTDYSTAPATVSGVEYDATDKPIRTW
jgi:YD repeat-containing protein